MNRVVGCPMSSYGHYGTLRTMDGGYGVRVLDIDGFLDWKHHGKAVTTREQFGDYPQTTYEVVWGITPYDEDAPDSPPLRQKHATYTVPRCHVGRNGFASFWAGLSAVTEPFWMWHAPQRGFVEPFQLLEDPSLAGYSLYCVAAIDGDVDYVEVPFRDALLSD